MSNNSKNGSGLSITGVLLIIFVTLKSLGLITWSWWWVISPVWIGALIVFGVNFLAIILEIIIESFED